MSKASIALVTAVAARHLDEDLPPLESALRNAGAKVTVAEWDRPHDWSRSDIALLRSTWDYTQRLPEFFAWAGKVAGETTLLNPLPVVQWNSDKHYLRDLADKGVPTVPSSFIEPGENAHLRIADLLSDPAVNEFVVKPAVGAGSRDAQRFGREEQEDAARHASNMLTEKRSVLLQPYLGKVDEHGETALMYFQGEFSHAIRKLPKRGDFRVQEEHGAEILPVDAPRELIELGGRAVRAAAPSLLYARADVLRLGNDGYGIIELELIEPSLYLRCDPGAPMRFARAFDAWMRG